MKTRSGENSRLSASKNVLDLAAVVGEEAVPEVADDDARLGAPSRSASALASRLGGALAVAAEHDPADLGDRALLDQLQDRAAAADLDVVGVGAEREQARRAGRRAAPSRAAASGEAPLATAPTCGARLELFQSSHGACAALVQVLEPLLVLERVHRRPEALVRLGEQLALGISRWNGSSTSSSPGCM